MKRFGLYSLLALLLFGCGVRRCCAQFIGYVTPQTVTTQPFGATATNCTGTQQLGLVQNISQTTHFISYLTIAVPSSMSVQLLGSFDGSRFFLISDTATDPNSGQIQGYGYYPQIVVGVTCATGGSFIVNYAGTSVTPSPPAGKNLVSVVNKVLVSGASLGSNSPAIKVPSPYGSSSGLLIFTPTPAAPPAGSSITVLCDQNTQLHQSWTFPLSTIDNQPQTFTVPPTVCLTPVITFTSGGASAGTFTLWLEYFSPGLAPPPSFLYANITSNTNTQVKAYPGILHSITFNTLGTTETLTLFDNKSACSGTKIATITVQTTEPFQLFDIQFNSGLCITTAGGAAGDYTVSYQ